MAKSVGSARLTVSAKIDERKEKGKKHRVVVVTAKLLRRPTGQVLAYSFSQS